MRAKHLVVVLLVVLSIVAISQSSAQGALLAAPNSSGQGRSAAGSKKLSAARARVRPAQPPHSSAQAAGTSLLSEGFEGSWPDDPAWTLFDNNPNNAIDDYLWGKRQCQPFAGQFSGMAVGGGTLGQNRSCTSNYPNNMDSWAIYGPLDLSSASSGLLTFHLRGKTDSTIKNQLPADYLFVGSSFVFDGTYNDSLYYGDWTGGAAANGYSQINTDLGPAGLDVLGNSEVWLAFVFTSDGSKTANGFTIDDITISVQDPSLPTDTPTNTPTTPTATPTTTPTATPTTTPSTTATPPTATPTTTPQRTPVPGPESRTIFIPIIGASPAACPAVSGQNDPADARLLATAGLPCNGAAKTQADGESHWYYADISAGQTLSVDLTGIPSGADYDIYLYDKQILQTLDLNSSVKKSTNDLNADEHFVYAPAAAGRYYLLVFLRTMSPLAADTYILKAERH